VAWQRVQATDATCRPRDCPGTGTPCGIGNCSEQRRDDKKLACRHVRGSCNAEVSG